MQWIRHLFKELSIRALLGLSAIICLSACDNPGDNLRSKYQDYSDRVARVLDEDSLPLPAETIPALPPQRMRHQHTIEIREGVIDVFDLRHCQLLNLVAERNSMLGKVAAPSAVLAYEMRFLSQLNLCIPKLIDTGIVDEDIIQRLKGIQRIKHENLNNILWNALYTGREIEATLSLNEPPLTHLPEYYQAAANALESIGSLLLNLHDFYGTADSLSNGQSEPTHQNSDELDKSLSNLESWYETLYKNPMGTSLLRSLNILTNTLNNTAEIIEKRLERRPLCFKTKTNPKADILKQVFSKYYAGIIQPHMALTHRLGQRWFDIHTQLHQKLKPPKGMLDYSAQVFIKDSPHSFWQLYIQARDRHTAAWQRILGQCNLMPKRN